MHLPAGAIEGFGWSIALLCVGVLNAGLPRLKIGRGWSIGGLSGIGTCLVLACDIQIRDVLRDGAAEVVALHAAASTFMASSVLKETRGLIQGANIKLGLDWLTCSSMDTWEMTGRVLSLR